MRHRGLTRTGRSGRNRARLTDPAPSLPARVAGPIVGACALATPSPPAVGATGAGTRLCFLTRACQSTRSGTIERRLGGGGFDRSGFCAWLGAVVAQLVASDSTNGSALRQSQRSEHLIWLKRIIYIDMILSLLARSATGQAAQAAAVIGAVAAARDGRGPGDCRALACLAPSRPWPARPAVSGSS